MERQDETQFTTNIDGFLSSTPPKSDREVEKFQNRAIVWRPVVTFCINLTIG
jgi:hypothetical protein